MTRKAWSLVIFTIGAWLWLSALWSPSVALAAETAEQNLSQILGEDNAAARTAVERVKAHADVRFLKVFTALEEGTLRVDTAGNAFIESGGKLAPALPGGAPSPTGRVRSPVVD